MTFSKLKSLTAGLLVGDMKLPQEDEVVLALLEKAMLTIASKSQALRLLTLSKDDAILRTGNGDYMVRFPDLPSTGSDVLDMDHELCFAAADLIASYIAKELPKRSYHVKQAEDTIEMYNVKVDSVMRQINEAEIGTTDNYAAGIPLEY